MSSRNTLLEIYGFFLSFILFTRITVDYKYYSITYALFLNVFAGNNTDGDKILLFDDRNQKF